VTLPGFSGVVFLSHVNEPGMPIFPGDPDFELRVAASVEQHGFYLQEMRIGEQSGTHWAAPVHFDPRGACAEDVGADELIRPAAIIDVRRPVTADPDFELGVADVESYERANGRIPGGALVVMWTGFSDRWRDRAAYLNVDADGVMHYPGFGLDVTRRLIDEREIIGLGIDSMGVDPGRDEGYGVNRLLLSGRRVHVENLTGLERMPASGGWIVIGGMRNSRGSGGPATVFGLVP
jgi:kynurenine formamidase